MFTTSDNHEIQTILQTIKDPTKLGVEVGPDFDDLIITDLWPSITPKLTLEALVGKNEFLAKHWLQGKSLDFGCGDGGAVLAAQNALGYDLTQQWEDHNSLTTSFQVVESQAPYDTIMLFDVLDHLEGVDVGIADHRSDWAFHLSTLKRLKALLKPTGKMLVRCHPYCSINGTHGKKAFAHLVGHDDGIFTHKIIRPQSTYNTWFSHAGLTVVNKQVTTRELPPFLQQTQIQERMLQIWKDDDYMFTRERLAHVVNVMYIDFELSK